MKEIIAVIDAGGRGSALVKKYAQSPHVKKIIAIPGNDYMRYLTKKTVLIYPSIATTDTKKILALCRTEQVTLVDVAQDNAVAAGLVDALEKEGFATIGPTKKAGELEWNKSFARDFMRRHNILQPEFFVFNSKQDGITFLHSQKERAWFVKASGLAEGKGALPARNNNEAIERIQEMTRFGNNGKTYLLEEWLIPKKGNSEEFSVFVATDGVHFSILGVAQDHKRVFTFDEGDNTGGMGCVSNPKVFSQQVKKQVTSITEKTLSGMRKEGRPYRGILYLGCMLIDEKVYVIEYNARWGDPEAQVILPGIQTDFVVIAKAILSKSLHRLRIYTDKKVRVAITVAAKGYPTDYSASKGKEVFGFKQLKKHSSTYLLGAGLKKEKGKFVISGGRVAYVIGEGKNITDARYHAYSAVSILYAEDNSLFYRTDIGYKDLERIYQK